MVLVPSRLRISNVSNVTNINNMNIFSLAVAFPFLDNVI